MFLWHPRDIDTDTEEYKSYCAELIRRVLAHKRIYMDSLKAERRELIELLDEYNRVLVEYKKDDDITDAIRIAAAPTDVTIVHTGGIHDAVWDAVEYRQKQISDMLATISATRYSLRENMARQEDVLMILAAYAATQAVIPAHHYVHYKVVHEAVLTQKGCAAELRTSLNNIKKMIEDEILAVYEIINGLDEHTKKESITPDITERMLLRNKELYTRLRKYEK